MPRSILVRPRNLTIVVEHCGNPQVLTMAGGETGDRPRDADRDEQLAVLMALVPDTAEEAAKIDREMGPDDDAWWGVQLSKAQVPATSSTPQVGALPRPPAPSPGW